MANLRAVLEAAGATFDHGWLDLAYNMGKLRQNLGFGY